MLAFYYIFSVINKKSNMLFILNIYYFFDIYNYYIGNTFLNILNINKIIF